MLSRTADNLYWLGRNIERAENTSRLLSGTQRLSLMPIPSGEQGLLWENLFQSDIERNAFLKKHESFTEQPVIEYLALDSENPTSIMSCIYAARENARAARNVLTTEISQSINDTWMEICGCTMAEVAERGPQDYLDGVRENTYQLRGAVYSTMRRGKPFMFWELGTVLERAENTSRLMLARSHAFHRATRRDDGFEFYRWGTFLRMANAYSAYRQMYRDIEPVSVADMLILNPELPRSLLSCMEDLNEILRTLKREARCTEMAEFMAAEVRTVRLDQILRSGVDSFLMDFRKQIHDLSDQIRLDFMMVR